MPLKRMSEFKREDYTYESPDGGEAYEITIVQTSDRKYVEIRRGDDEVQWDVEMLLDIADAVRQATQKHTKSNKPHQLKKPNIVDHREDSVEKTPAEKTAEKTPAETTQDSVDESMENMDLTIAPVQSFSPEAVAADIARRKGSKKPVPKEAQIKRTDSPVQAKDLF